MNKKNRGAIIIEGHVQGLANTRALGKEGVDVIVIDVKACVASKSKYCTKYFKCPPFLSDEFIVFLEDLAKTEGLQNWLLLPSNDHAVYNISKNKERLKKHYKITTPELEIIENIYDKVKLLEIAKKENIPIPATHCFSSASKDIPSEINFPLITKGRNGLSFYKTIGKKAVLADSKEIFTSQLKEISEKIDISSTFTQELIPFDGSNKTISVAAFCINGEIKTHWMGSKVREHPLQFGTATFTESVFFEECLTYSAKILKALDYSGVCEVEFLKDPRDGLYKLIEINARTWLWVGHAIACGKNFPLYLYNYVNNIETIYPNRYQNGIKWRNPFPDFIFNLVAIIKRKTTISQILKQNSGKVVSALWEKGDIKPFFRYAWLMFAFLKNR